MFDVHIKIEDRDDGKRSVAFKGEINAPEELYATAVGAILADFAETKKKELGLDKVHEAVITSIAKISLREARRICEAKGIKLTDSAEALSELKEKIKTAMENKKEENET